MNHAVNDGISYYIGHTKDLIDFVDIKVSIIGNISVDIPYLLILNSNYKNILHCRHIYK